ncbi:4,5-dihydroxyphthalate decarboxylase [Streptomyces sp. SID5785]|uniref:phosphate/phosphite/phosphonate ABC transporter substrate-binding protein n=1 Tax=Streptomyces sp. SID5785 TaxID=2690309 RepID=UPI0013612753|nr:phosphate/phosphite/phosphonate ABC transporter substrate-binding protein [Streptomyces sp. SID5785]MZD08616.1 4,5-dihydroxyphthalate decarboxylase [Streptomyces sp. SID5785]
MSGPRLTVGCFPYDTTRPLLDGSVGIDGAEVSVRTGATLPEIFERLVCDEEFDVAELGLTFYLRLLEAGTLPYVALPVFPVRMFRHSAVFVNTHSGVRGPRDLAGRTIGEFGTYGQDPGVWNKGVLMDEYGFRPESSRWVIGGLDRPAAPFAFTPHPHPADVDVRPAPEGKSLGGMLDAGEIDVLFTANVPQCVLDGSPNVTRLFPDFEAVERDYYRRTGIFPIMHTVVMRRDLLRERPELAHSVQRAFTRAKDLSADRYRQRRRWYQAQTMVPWMNSLVDRNADLFPEDWWPYGVSANRTTLDTFLRYHVEQGLSSRRWTVDEIFAAELLDT